MASKNVIIHEGEEIKTLSDVAKIKTFVAEGGTCYWVPEDSVRLTTLSVTRDGIYRASTSGYYGYSEVIVSGVGSTILADLVTKEIEITDNGTYEYLATDDGHNGYSKVRINVNVDTSHTTTKDPVTGEDVDTRADPVTGNTVTTTLPYLIAVDTKPNKLKYVFGDTIDYTGIEVYAYLRSGAKWTNDNYPNGRIPFNELILPTVTAGDYSAGSISEDSSDSGSSPSSSMSYPSDSGSTSSDYYEQGTYKITITGSIASLIDSCLSMLGRYSGISASDIKSMISSYDGINPAIVTVYTNKNEYFGPVMRIYVFNELEKNDDFELGSNQPCLVFTVNGNRSTNGDTIILSNGGNTSSYSVIYTGSKTTNTTYMASTLTTNAYTNGDGLNTIAITCNLYTVESTGIQYVLTDGPVIYRSNAKEDQYVYLGMKYENFVGDNNANPYYTKRPPDYHDVKFYVTRYNGYIYYLVAEGSPTLDLEGYCFTTNENGEQSIHKWMMTTRVLYNYKGFDDMSKYPYRTKRFTQYGYEGAEKWIDVPDSTVDPRSIGEINQDDLRPVYIKGSGGGSEAPGSSTVVNPVTSITQNLRVEWKRPKDNKLLVSAFPITVASRNEGGWENQ